MQDSVSGSDHVTPDRIELGPEFLAGNTEQGLERLRRRLLDLTNRNRLLNYRHRPASSIRIVQAHIDRVFEGLTDGVKLAFEPVPEPSEEDFIRSSETGQLRRPDPVQYAKWLGWNISYDLTTEGDQAESLRVLQYRDQLESTIRKMESKERTIIEESGSNMLYLACGFLEWYESDNSEESHLAPILMLPVNLEHGKGTRLAIIEYSGDDIECNPSLAERLQHDFNLDLPLRAEDESPGTYLSRLQEVLDVKPRWKLYRFMTLTFLSFSKILMYRDLDPRSWPAGSLPQHPRIRELFEGKKEPNPEYAVDYEIDSPQLKGRVPHLILDADSSQHSALIDAIEGKNLALEGPPGTGKSQTITNLIAIALAQGKTVLFVAEKLAALEVVRKRLDDCGLGAFCLELHSHKTQKQGLIRDLEVRLNCRQSFRDPAELEAKKTLLSEKREWLNRYVMSINRVWPPLQKSVFDVLWARELSIRQLSVPLSVVNLILLPFAPEIGPEELERTQQFLEVYGRHLKSITTSPNPVVNHPWSWVANPFLTFRDEARLIELLRALARSGAEIQSTLAWLSASASLELDAHPASLSRAAELLKTLPLSVPVAPTAIVKSCRSAEIRRGLNDFIRCVRQARDTIEIIETRLTKPYSWDRELGSRLAESVSKLERIGIRGKNVAEVRDILICVEELASYLRQSTGLASKLSSLIPVPLGQSLPSLRLALKSLELIDSAPHDFLHLRTPGMMQPGSLAAVRDARDEASRLRARRSELAQQFHLELIPSPETLLTQAQVLDASGFWKRMFGADYRAAKRAFRSISKRKRARLQMAVDFRLLAVHQRKILVFHERNELSLLLRDSFRGLDTDWAGILEVCRWCERIHNELPQTEPGANHLREFLFASESANLRVVHDEARPRSGELNEARTLIDKTSAMLSNLHPLIQSNADDPLSLLTDRVQALIATLRSCLDSFEMANLQESVRLPEILDVVQKAETVYDLLSSVRSNKLAIASLGALNRELGTPLEPIEKSLQLAEALDCGKLPAATVDWLLSEKYLENLKELHEKLYLLTHSPFSTECEEIARISGTVAEKQWFGSNLSEILERACRLLESHEQLREWVQYLKHREEAKRRQLHQVTTLADEGTISPDDLLAVFRFTFYNSLGRAIFEAFPELSEFAGATQEEIRKQFATLDHDVIQLTRRRIANVIDRRGVPHGNHSGPVKTWTDLSLITQEVSKQKRHIPVRQLVRRASAALQALKPCFMMGPLSVAQYLAPDQLSFDIVVMDEASQMRPEDAIGAVARGGQLIVVGDPKQLPPTDFFQRTAIDDDQEDDDRAVAEEGESILDVAMSLYHPARRLRWHYRSRHHSLIAFSNKEFYGGDLILFPASHRQKEDLGIRYHEVTVGLYEDRRNGPEAEIVVEAILEHIKEHPDESLGVVTLNLEQRELIEELYQKALKQEVFAQAYVERFNEGLEPLFVKNLENVQGDERDVIFISCTYGPDRKGNQYQRFGPINSQKGHRRLNVLFTRAKKRVEVFSSLDPEKIVVETRSAWGIRALKNYLLYAKTGHLEETRSDGREPTNDFELSVAELLREQGYKVEAQVGVAGFFIDLAIVHPYKAGTWLVGIECDGASYHSARSARDRDRLRQEILVSLGWTIYRVWSTDWFRSREREATKLLSYIESLLAGDPEAQRVRSRENNISAVRRRLIEFREKTVKTAFPNTPPDRCLLRDSLLDALVQFRVATKDDWFRKIPMAMRTGTQAEQIGRFLDEVLQIISQHL
ncbi:MAG: DUF4011 domain-containing protein [Terriglobia bacterium]|jgi:very-short-patch-repair endonuclease/DNA polymerase III delta prime subunit